MIQVKLDQKLTIFMTSGCPFVLIVTGFHSPEKELFAPSFHFDDSFVTILIWTHFSYRGPYRLRQKCLFRIKSLRGKLRSD